MKKVFLTLFVIILLVGGAAWYFVTQRLDGVIEQQIEKSGSAALGTAVRVGGVHTRIREGSIEIAKITVANPPGYKNVNAVILNSISAAVDYDGFEIKRVVIDKPEVVIEEKGGQTNFGELLAHVENTETAPEEAESEEPTIVIRHFRMNQSRAAFESETFDRYTDLKVDAIELNDLSGTPAEVATVIAREIVKELSSEAATEILKAQAAKKYEEVEGKISDKLKNVFGEDDDT